MISILTADADYALRIYCELRPDLTELAKKRFRSKVAAHLGRDYSGARLLRSEGLDGCRAVPAIELIDYDDESLGVEVNHAVIVDDGKGGIRFDSDELLMYNTFTRDPVGVASRKQEIINRKLEQKNETT